MLVISQFINIMNQEEEADYKSESFYLCEISWQLTAAREAVEGVSDSSRDSGNTIAGDLRCSLGRLKA